MASVTIRVHQPVLGWPSGSIQTVERTSLIDGLISNGIAELLSEELDPPTGDGDTDVDSDAETGKDEPDAADPEPAKASTRAPRPRTAK
ncbi:hypothetical protein HH308_06335 [Gordonia sp. TBRC 11910]|uniref:Uncharacterized protein n=1 Tax=Gordonia asplenii TaxID=2725283 RepID=A0A848KR27_9ACTN|nr:hypothetical protein [Gordonia asplenii]NMO00830.1 hypothetical protein [Gordonia asplenii]